MTARMLGVATTVAALLVGPAIAHADVQPFGSLHCAPQDGVSFCQGQTSAVNDQRIKSFDGVPLDTDVALPASGDANLPLVVLLHGWGGSKVGFAQMKPWTDRGYAVLSYTARGFNGRADDPTTDCSTRAAARRAGCTSPTSAGRSGTHSSSPASSPTRA